jgi:predicted DNA-binding transcriptional regulator AlpA
MPLVTVKQLVIKPVRTNVQGEHGMKNDDLLSNGIDRMMDQKELASMLGISVKTLEGWRWRKIGPRFIKLGRLARYRMSDVMAYIQGLIKEVEAQSCDGK